MTRKLLWKRLQCQKGWGSKNRDSTEVSEGQVPAEAPEAREASEKAHDRKTIDTGLGCRMTTPVHISGVFILSH